MEKVNIKNMDFVWSVDHNKELAISDLTVIRSLETKEKEKDVYLSFYYCGYFFPFFCILTLSLELFSMSRHENFTTKWKQ